MRKTWIIVTVLVLVVFTLVGTARATEITFDKAGDVYIKYLGGTAGYDNTFGWVSGVQPGITLHQLGTGKSTPPNTEFSIGYRAANEPIVLYITSPPLGGSHTYYSDPTSANPDGINHVKITPVGSDEYEVNCGFEDIYNGGDKDYDDILLTVRLEPTITPIPEFPAMALPAALIVGMLGAVLFIRRTREN
jgi:hypothetical protein